MIARLQEFVEKAMNLVTSDSDDGVDVRQAYGDMLVEGVLLALPWGGKTLFDQEKDAMEKCMERLHDYMASRPQKV